MRTTHLPLWGFVVAAASSAFILPTSLAAAEVNVGDPAPSFSALDETGKTWKSEDHVGKKILVVYFYPADFTGGCTRQACGFRDDMKKLTAQGVEVVGVSGDSASTHAKFKEAYKLPFTLLADSEGSVAKAFGVPAGKGGKITRTIQGKDEVLKRGVTIRRWTFVIGKDGKIALKNDSVNAGKDSKAVLDFVNKLNATR